MIELFYNLTVMNSLFLAIALCIAKPNKWSISALLMLAVVWPFANGDLEGDILIPLSATHAVTASDLLSVAAVLVAAFEVIRLRRAARESEGRDADV